MGRTLVLSRSVIKVSRNQYCPNGMLARHEYNGVLPGCRTIKTLSYMPCANAINIRPLYGYNGSAYIRPEKWAEVIKASPVVGENGLEITPEIREWAYRECLDVCTCPAVANLSDVHPDYLKNQRFDSIDPVFASGVRHGN